MYVGKHRTPRADIRMMRRLSLVMLAVVALFVGAATPAQASDRSWDINFNGNLHDISFYHCCAFPNYDHVFVQGEAKPIGKNWDYMIWFYKDNASKTVAKYEHWVMQPQAGHNIKTFDSDGHVDSFKIQVTSPTGVKGSFTGSAKN